MQIHVHADARGTVARQSKDLSLRRRIFWIKTGAHQHLFAVECPALHEDSILMLTTNFVAKVICDRELEEMPRDAFVTKDRPRIFDCCANIKIWRLRTVGGNEIESGRIFIVNAWRIHESARTGRLKSFRQLANLKCAEIIGQRDKLMFLQKINHFLFPTFISF